MYVQSIEVTNLRGFKGTQSVSLQRPDGSFAGWTVFAGRNGSGKSTLLRAVAASLVGPLAARSLAGSFSGWVRQGEGFARVAVQVTVDAERDKFSAKGGTSEKPFWTGLEWKAHSGGSDVIERWLDKESGSRRKASERGPWADTPDGWFAVGYGAHRRLGPTTPEVARLSADPSLARLINLYNESATLSDAVDWLKTVHLRALEEKSGAGRLRDDVLKLLGAGLLPDGSAVERVDSDGLWIKRDGIQLPLEQVSDGYRSVAALVVDIARRLHATYKSLELSTNENGELVCPLPGVVLIDEVDAHMHVSWQQRIGFWLREHFPKLQFLVTTHSPFICQAASPAGIVRLPAPGEPRGIEHIDDRLFKSIVNGGADDAVMSELFGLEHAHSAPAERLRDDVAALEFKAITGEATEADLSQLTKLKADLPDDLSTLADQKLRALQRPGDAT